MSDGLSTLRGALRRRRQRLGRRLFEWLTGSARAELPEVREAQLRTLPDSLMLLALSTLWSQTPAWTARWLADGWGPMAWILVDLALNGLRWRLYLRSLRAAAPGLRPVQIAMVVVAAGWVAQMAIGIAYLYTLPDVRAAVMGALVGVGFAGYVVTHYAAFKRLAGFLVGCLATAVGVGLLMSPLPGLFQIGLMIPSGIVAYYVLLSHNHGVMLDALRSQQENLKLSRHDPLTGLPNRLVLDEWLSDLCRRLRRDGEAGRFAVMCLDLDGFKEVNDRHGHPVGDQLLKRIAQRLRQAARDDDLVCRIGGDEFVVVLPAADRATATLVATRLVGAIRATLELGSARVHVGTSIGIALGPDDGDAPEALLAHADAALYEEKRAGKGGWRLCA